jgi:hypothetical protein
MTKIVDLIANKAVFSFTFFAQLAKLVKHVIKYLEEKMKLQNKLSGLFRL